VRVVTWQIWSLNIDFPIPPSMQIIVRIDQPHFERHLDVNSHKTHAMQILVRKWEILVIKISLSFHSSAWTSNLRQGCPTLLQRGPQLLLWASWPAPGVKITNGVPNLLLYCVVFTVYVICKCYRGPRIGHPCRKGNGGKTSHIHNLVTT
jgi:hypothetical protein